MSKRSPLLVTLKAGVIYTQCRPSVRLFIPESVFYTQSVMLSPRFIPQSVLYSQSVVRSPKSVFYTDRNGTRLSEKSQVTEKPQTFFSNHNSYGSCKNTLVRRSSQKEQVFHGICIQYYTIERKNGVISDPVVCIDLRYFFFSLLQKKRFTPFEHASL